MSYFIPNIPMWTRGEPGFYFGQYLDGRWYWQFRDAKGNAVEEATVTYDAQEDAARFCATYWRVAHLALTELAQA